MAEQDDGQEHLSGTIAGNTFSVNVRDLISVLLLVGIFGLGWLVWDAQKAAMRLLYQGQQAIFAHLEAQDKHVREQTLTIVRLVYALDYNQQQPPDKRVPLHLYEPDDARGRRRYPEEHPR